MSKNNIVYERAYVSSKNSKNGRINRNVYQIITEISSFVNK